MLDGIRKNNQTMSTNIDLNGRKNNIDHGVQRLEGGHICSIQGEVRHV